MENINNEVQEMPVSKIAETVAEKSAGNRSSNIELLMDVSLKVTVELGRTRMQLARIIELKHGSVVELDRLAGDPVDVFVNDHMVARGEVVVVDDKFGVRIIEMVSANGEKVTP